MTKLRPIEIAAGAGLMGALVFAVSVPADAVQGDLSRIMYVHVPSAWLAYVAFGVTLLGSVMYLVQRRLRWDSLAASSAELGVVFTGLALVTGSIWGKPVWGVWWTWDARLVLTALMFFVYLAYLALRGAVDDPQVRGRRSAVFGILAVVQVPIVHFSVVWWRSLHQPPTVLRPDDPQIDGPLLGALLVGVAAFTLVYVALLRRRMTLDVVAPPTSGAPEAVAGAAVGRPTVGGRDV